MEVFLCDETGYGKVTVEFDYRSVHPALIFIHKGEVGSRVRNDSLQHPVLKNYVRFKEYGIILTQVFRSKEERVDIVGRCIVGIVHE